jgi:hypothetical protein
LVLFTFSLSPLEALAKKRQQLFGGAESEFQPGIDFFNPSIEMTVGRSCFICELNHKGLSFHQVSVSRGPVGRCEVSVQFPLYRLPMVP